MVRHLRIAILPLVVAATPITHAMAEGLAAKTQATPYDTRMRIILVDRYEDITGCKKACEDDRKECQAMQSFRGLNTPEWNQAIKNCAEIWRECRDACYK